MSYSHKADAVMGMNHFKVAMQCYNCHERNAGRAIDRQHKVIDAAPDMSKHPVFLPQVSVDTEGHADDEQEVS